MSKSCTHFRVPQDTQMQALKTLASAGLLASIRQPKHYKILRKTYCVMPYYHYPDNIGRTGCFIEKHWTVNGQQIRCMVTVFHLMAIDTPKYLLMKGTFQRYTCAMRPTDLNSK